jgi:hypothetical protein
MMIGKQLQECQKKTPDGTSLYNLGVKVIIN